MTPPAADIPSIPFGLRAYRFATSLSAPIADIALSMRLSRGKEDPKRISERRGAAGAERPDGALVWIHGASVGESLSVLPLVQRLSDMRPDLNFLVTTGTITSAKLMAERLPANARHQFAPLDHPNFIKTFLDHWRPDLAVFVESEFWPNLILETDERRIPLALVNGRISPKTFTRWRKRPNTIGRLLGAFDIKIAQDGENAERLSDLSASEVKTYGNLKMAAPPLPTDGGALEQLRAEIGVRPVWLASSTHPGEEEIVCAAHAQLKDEYPDLLTILVPRHPLRGSEAAAIAETYKLRTAQRSKGDEISAYTDIYIGDTLGELGVFYRLCDIVFVGGSIAEKGGHNPLEPARLHSAILHGPHTFNFVETYMDMRKAGGAALVRNDLDLAASARRLFRDEKTRAAMSAAAMKTAEESAERVLCDIVEALGPYIPAAETGR